MDKEKAREELRKLIEKFKLNYQKYKGLAEPNIETKLVEELFINILGWTKDDFIQQEKARRGEKGGRADYAFYINDRIVFFLEVKRVGVRLEKEADKQVISYALSRRVPFAVSTNFEELKIFCVESADKALFRRFENPDSYLSNFEDLLFLSKEYFEQGLTLQKAASEERLKKRISIDKPLLEDLMYIRKLISDDIENRYPLKYGINDKDEIVQRIIDRLIFIRRCEDTGINPENRVLEEIKHLPDNKAYPLLKEIFILYNLSYNSGLFKPAKDNDCDSINIDGAIIKKLTYYLYESKDGKYIYDFDWIDADVLGQVYEQYLGKILAQTKSGRSKLKEGQAHRKEQGIYYTPTYIVDYIVKNTVGELLKDKKIDIKKIKILDPACGSGSFLIKAFDYLAKHLSGSDDAKQQRIDSQGKYSIKTEILKNNIYGVDLDQKAVEITKLNLLLKAAEKERKLPEEVDLHVRHGNSLIDDETVAGLSAFKWEGDFKEGSFDVVIGNPPYIRIQTLEDDSVNFFNTHYKSATRNYDIYALFVERGLSLLKEGGILGFILPSKFFNADYGEGLRRLIAENKALYNIVDFKDFQVFENATTYTCLLFLKKGKNKQFEYLELVDKDNLSISKTMTHFTFKKSRQEQPCGIEKWNFVSNEYKPIMEKLSSKKLRLKDIAESIFQGIITGADKIYIIIKKANNLYCSLETGKNYKFESELLHPLLKGSRHIRKYRIDPSEKVVIFPYRIIDGKAIPIHEDELRCKYPVIYDYLLENKTTLQKRDNGKMKGSSWYLFSRNQNLTRFGQEKIMTPCIAKSPSFTFDSHKDFFFVGSGGGGGGAYGITLQGTSRRMSSSPSGREGQWKRKREESRRSRGEKACQRERLLLQGRPACLAGEADSSS